MLQSSHGMRATAGGGNAGGATRAHRRSGRALH
eukprot:CAMPEP_0181210234 /NCGR_PEP_ID=MMETSP1096-20121128/23115_1 /TAXON_ID=156174 ORGANISM="Chrysochromulina ericina, Strain CCMP281" /NCGR_SAMPLE_ID=MMETSP1096 /ASSEMBLY_ACC=CAM_ASM_000453 /LENGTH=32 /DNA_ID= /DNA_START= /DNA_END= /DNA_ORIENTATION=